MDTMAHLKFFIPHKLSPKVRKVALKLFVILVTGLNA